MFVKEEIWEGNPHPFRVVGYYTALTSYENEKEVLRLSLESLGYSYFFGGVKTLGSWQRNTQLKAKFIEAMLIRFPGPILYLDVDCIMVQKPVILDTVNCDIAAVHFADTKELLSGTVYFANTEAAKAVVQNWIALNAAYPLRLPDGRVAWDQRTLEMAIQRTSGCRFHELPQEYTWITELTQKRYPGLAPVLMHTRGAYRFKREINRRGLR